MSFETIVKVQKWFYVPLITTKFGFAWALPVDSGRRL